MGQCVQDSAENTIRGNSFLSIFDLKLPNEAGKKFSCVLYFARSHVFFRSIGNRFLNGWSFIKTCRLSVHVLVCLSVCFLFALVPLRVKCWPKLIAPLYIKSQRYFFRLSLHVRKSL